MSIGLILMLALFGAVVVLSVFSAVEEITPAKYFRNQASLPELSASAWEVFDLETGEVLYAREPDAVLPIASVTKLLTASTFFKQANLEATTDITWGDVSAEGRAGKLAYGDTYTNRELLFPLLLESSNDAASAIDRVSLDIVYDINSSLNNLGLEDTVIADTSGLSDKNVSTAHELALITRHLYHTEPHIFDITQISAYYADENGWINNSPFILDDAYRGGKHGFTYAAGRTAVALFEETLNGGADRLLGYVILGSNDLAEDMELLREFVHENTSYR